MTPCIYSFMSFETTSLEVNFLSLGTVRVSQNILWDTDLKVAKSPIQTPCRGSIELRTYDSWSQKRFYNDIQHSTEKTNLNPHVAQPVCSPENWKNIKNDLISLNHIQTGNFAVFVCVTSLSIVILVCFSACHYLIWTIPSFPHYC